MRRRQRQMALGLLFTLLVVGTGIPSIGRGTVSGEPKRSGIFVATGRVLRHQPATPPASSVALPPSPPSVAGAPPPASTPFPPPPAPPLRILEMQATTGVVFKHPLDDVKVFRPDQHEIYAWFRWTDAKPGARVTGRLLYRIGDRKIEALKSHMQIFSAEDKGHVTFRAADAGTSWPEGNYRIEIVANDILVGALDIEVRR
ncbi:MAG: hypothetical protein ACE5I9_06205 [Candidatus Methylomirabilales bacterium]